MTLEEMPPDATHWSTRSMAAATGMSQSAVSRIWQTFALKPGHQEARAYPHRWAASGFHAGSGVLGQQYWGLY
jgi:DNA-binding MurR/RpiR family transcriptional regulator